MSDKKEPLYIRLRKETEEKLHAFPNNEGVLCYHPKNAKVRFLLPLLQTDYIQQSIFVEDDYYEIQYLREIFDHAFGGRVIKRKVQYPGTIVVDIGANIGNHSLYFASEIGAPKVIAFEPVNEIFNMLVDNIDLNHLRDRIEPHCIGLSDEENVASIARYFDSNIGMTKLQVGNGIIKISALDSFKFEQVSFVKIDVEGMEVDVLKGATTTIEKSKPFIMMEIDEEENPGHLAEVKQILCEMEYRFFQLNKSEYLFWPIDIELESIYQNKKKEIYDRISTHKSIIIFGAYTHGMIVFNMLNDNTEKRILFCDNDEDKQKSKCCGQKVISLQEAIMISDKLIMIPWGKSQKEKKMECEVLGVSEKDVMLIHSWML